MSSLHIPEDIIFEILVNLPVKYLLQFKCVSKSWCSLINNPRFIARHLNDNQQKKENGYLFVHNKDNNCGRFAFALYPDKTLTVPEFEYLGPKLKKAAGVFGPCNGIFLLVNHHNLMALWNPATREFRGLPKIPQPKIGSRVLLQNYKIGFGVDPFTDDYKVVSIRMYWDYSLDPRYHDTPSYYFKHIYIYSSHGDSWREYTGFFPECFVFQPDISFPYIDGVYYWSGCDKDDRRLYISFHMGYEVFHEIVTQDEPGPTEFQGIEGVHIPPDIGPNEAGYSLESGLGIYNDSLAWVKIYPSGTDTPNYVNILVLKSEQNWTWTTDLIAGPIVGAGRPLGIWKNGELLVKGRNRHLCLLNLNSTMEMKDLGTVARQAFVYQESLVSVKRRNQLDPLLDSSFDALTLEYFFQAMQ